VEGLSTNLSLSLPPIFATGTRKSGRLQEKASSSTASSSTLKLRIAIPKKLQSKPQIPPSIGTQAETLRDEYRSASQLTNADNARPQIDEDSELEDHLSSEFAQTSLGKRVRVGKCSPLLLTEPNETLKYALRLHFLIRKSNIFQPASKESKS
jgi:hypothetical protein